MNTHTETIGVLKKIHHCPVLRRYLPALAALAAATTTPSLLAGKGGKGGGKPGGDGGGDPPAVTPVYSATPIPSPSWADAHSPSSLNNDGMVVGWATVEVSRDTFASTHGFLFDGSETRQLPGLPGDHASWPQDISDGGAVIVGTSTGSAGRQPAAWLKQADGSYAVLSLGDTMLAYAAANLPGWPIESFEIGWLQNHVGVSILSHGGEFLVATANRAGANSSEIDVLMRWDWLGTAQPQITGMWVLGYDPSPDQDGFDLRVDSLELGYKNHGTPEEKEVVWMAGIGHTTSYSSSYPSSSSCHRMAFDPATGEFDLTDLADSVAGAVDGISAGDAKSRGIGDAVNALGEVAGSIRLVDWTVAGYAWGIDGTPETLALLPGATRSRAEDMNAAGEIVGISGVACLWSLQTGEAFDLDALTEGNPGLTRAHSINERGQITAGWFDYKGSRLQATNFYLLTPILAP